MIANVTSVLNHASPQRIGFDSNSGAGLAEWHGCPVVVGDRIIAEMDCDEYCSFRQCAPHENDTVWLSRCGVSIEGDDCVLVATVVRVYEGGLVALDANGATLVVDSPIPLEAGAVVEIRTQHLQLHDAG